MFDDFSEKGILDIAIEQASVAILMTDIDGDIIYVNPAFEDMTGYKREELLGENPRILKSGLTPGELYDKMWATISKGQPWNGEQINKRKDGSIYYEDSRITPIYNKDNELAYYLAVKHDITSRKELEMKLKRYSIRDSLTNAYNRRYLRKRLDQISDSSRRKGSVFSIGILDIDIFKNINDRYGHQAGDSVLVEFTNIISENIRSYDILCRYGGEEFIIVFPDTDKEDAYLIVKRISEMVKDRNFLYQDHSIRITFSAGISDSNESLDDDFNIEEIIRLTDEKLYWAKNNGRNQIIK